MDSDEQTKLAEEENAKDVLFTEAIGGGTAGAEKVVE